MRPYCPIQKDFEDVKFSARNLAHKMGRLRRQMRQCQECTERDCLVLKAFNTAVREALQEVAGEFGVIKMTKP